ncbi:uncharacterized protein KGF55_000811 [Candida pseudojiufengensis]|uniref:uncharacterized protein n=1 Tax=Candida pseudojiufengensis TaxID=497109 RepID=UPI002224F6F4|nr:uncharacterized protein KGF55_000811 [Candida pseudojiufengensis]KAI5966502.1 hypothetical protein KGF55_000811 [Candida pseudojiufengensis]
MGSNTSKPETKVFTPSTPIDFSSTFLSQLEQSPESDYSRAQYTEKYIQDRVAKELTKLEKETIKNFKDTTNKALLKDDKKDQNAKISVSQANDKIVQLTQLLKENAALEQANITPEIKQSRESVIQCLKNNQGKSLNCWNEVETFKNLVRDL